MIKAIIFDCFGVLTNSVWQEFWKSLPTTEMQQQARELNQAFDGGHISKEEFSSQLREITKRPDSEIQKILFDTEPMKNNKLIDYIRALKPKYKISVLSNVASTWMEDYLLTSEELKLFDDILLSFKVGITKPDPRIFQMAAERLGVELSECVFVDDIERYCTAAKDAGMKKAIVYKDFEQFKHELEEILHEQ